MAGFGDELKRLMSKARMRAPRFVRTAFRLVRSLSAGVASKAMPTDLVKDCRVFGSRHDMLDGLPMGGVVAELGTFKGEFARAILHRCRPRELHVVDIDYSFFDAELGRDPRVTCHTGLTTDVLAGFPDEFFDWVYVDADHSYKAALADAMTAAGKIKIGGLIVFNDFAHNDLDLGRYGVHRAATDFALEKRWPMAFFALDPNALYDVAFRRTS